MIILPGDEGFSETLGTLPPGWKSAISSANNANFIVRNGSNLLELVDEEELIEYVEGGEYDERLIELENEEIIHFDL